MLRLLCVCGAALISSLATGQAPQPATPRARAFAPGAVRLLPGPFQRALQLNAQQLLSLDPDRLLSWYRREAGLEPKGEVYGGWESRGIAGHSLGHYLTACALMYRASGDDAFRQRLVYAVIELAACQRAHGDGYLGAMPEGRRVFAEVARGDIRSQGFDLNGSWVPWYNLHKLYAGLIDAYRYGDVAEALPVVVGMADWAEAVTAHLTPDQWQQMLACEHGGMNESLAELYALTGEQRYLDLARKFYHRAILDPLAEGRDELQGKHANTQIPKAIGAARIHQLAGDPAHGRAAQFFWDAVVARHTYVTGGNSEGEHFGPPGQLSDRLGTNTAETCNTYNMLKLTSLLFEREPRAQYADYAERALWNHILAARHPATGRVCYFLTLQPGATRHFIGELDFTCCNGSGMEIPLRTLDYLFYHSDDALWVNQFIPAEAQWSQRGVTIRQETAFPDESQTKLTLRCAAPTTFALHVRRPPWAGDGFAIAVNGEQVDVDAEPGSFASLAREWADGDVVLVSLPDPLPLRTEPMPDNDRRVAILAGPIVLAGDLSDAEDDDRVPALVTDGRPVEQWVVPTGERPLRYRTQGVGRPRDVALLPFYAAYDGPATVYWDLFDADQWAAHEAQYRAAQQRRAALDARTVDVLALGEMQPERDHGVAGEKTAAGEFQRRKFRHAWDGGWFSCELAVPAAGPAELIVDYWGGETGAREFDVQVDGQRIATTSLQMDAPGQFWQQTYPLPVELIAGKERVTVRFQAQPGNYAGGVFGIRVAAPESEPRP